MIMVRVQANDEVDSSLREEFGENEHDQGFNQANKWSSKGRGSGIKRQLICGQVIKSTNSSKRVCSGLWLVSMLLAVLTQIALSTPVTYYRTFPTFIYRIQVRPYSYENYMYQETLKAINSSAIDTDPDFADLNVVLYGIDSSGTPSIRNQTTCSSCIQETLNYRYSSTQASEYNYLKVEFINFHLPQSFQISRKYFHSYSGSYHSHTLSSIFDEKTYNEDYIDKISADDYPCQLSINITVNRTNIGSFLIELYEYDGSGGSLAKTVPTFTLENFTLDTSASTNVAFERFVSTEYVALRLDYLSDLLYGSKLTIQYECHHCSVLIDNCIDCQGVVTCIQCDTGFYVNQNFNCSLCNSSIQFCTECSQDGQICTACLTDYYLFNGNTKCIDCVPFIDYCSECTSLTTCTRTSVDTYCIGPDSMPTLCINALDNCYRCSDNSTCLECYDYFYVSPDTHTCVPCEQLACRRCTSATVCTECDSGFEVHESGNCTCSEGYFVPEGCTQVPGCLTVRNITSNETNTCLLCDFGFAYNITTRRCGCQIGFLLQNGFCVEECGDGTHFYDECDDGNLIDHDGCSQNCQVEAGHQCIDGVSPHFDKSICKKLGTFNITFLYIKKVDTQNKGEIHFQVSSSLDNHEGIATSYDFQRLIAITAKANISGVSKHSSRNYRRLESDPLTLNVNSVKYFHINSKIIVGFDYEEDLVDREISVVFDFTPIAKDFTSAEVTLHTSNMFPPLKYSENQTIKSALETLAMIIGYSSLIFFFISILVHKTIGIETLNVIQLCFAQTMLSKNQISAFRTMHPLSLSMGITTFLQSSWSNLIYPEKYRTLSEFRKIEQNINLFFFLLITATILYILLELKRRFNTRSVHFYNEQISEIKKTKSVKGNTDFNIQQLQQKRQDLIKEVKIGISRLQLIYERFLFPLSLFLTPALLLLLCREADSEIENQPRIILTNRGTNMWQVALSLIILNVDVDCIRRLISSQPKKEIKVAFVSFSESCKEPYIQQYVGLYVGGIILGSLSIISINFQDSDMGLYIGLGTVALFVSLAIYIKCASPYVYQCNNNTQALNFLILALCMSIMSLDHLGLLTESEALLCVVVELTLFMVSIGLGSYRLYVEYRFNSDITNPLNFNIINMASKDKRREKARKNVKETLADNPFVFRQPEQMPIINGNIQLLQQYADSAADKNESGILQSDMEELSKLKQRLRQELIHEKQQIEAPSIFKTEAELKANNKWRRLF